MAGAYLQGVDMNWNPEVSGWCNWTNHEKWLQMDQACLAVGHVKNNISENGSFELWGQSEKCLEVSYWISYEFFVIRSLMVFSVDVVSQLETDFYSS